MKHLTTFLGVILGTILGVTLSSCTSTPINIIQDSHFDADGNNLDELLPFVRSDSLYTQFFVEVSGSMNGFFRSNKPTAFKKDIWSIFTNLAGTDGDVNVFTAQNQPPQAVSMQQFRTRMNTGAFVSTASTDVPTMIQYIIDNTPKPAVSVLVSDMKYSPVGNRDIAVLLSQYSAEVRNKLTGKGLAWTLIAAYSDNIAANGQVACEVSPYYYWVVGEARRVASVRNAIGIMLNREGRLVSMVDGGMDLQTPPFKLVQIKNALKTNEQCLSDYEAELDECSFNIELDLSDYPWALADTSAYYLSKIMTIKSTRGAIVNVGEFGYSISDQDEKYMRRQAIVTIPVSVKHLVGDGDVIEVKFDIQNKYFVGKMQDFFDGAINEGQLDKSFSVQDFISGAMSVSPIVFGKEPIRILISTTKAF